MEIPNIAIPNLPLCNKVTISIENVEKVVKAPQKPVITKAYSSDLNHFEQNRQLQNQ